MRQGTHIWLKALSDRVQKQEMKELLEKISSITQKFDRVLADSVLEVSVSANRQLVEELRGEGMCQALLEIMQPEINEIVESTVQKKIQDAISNAVKGFRDLGADDEKIKELLMKNYDLTPKEAAMYL